MGAKSRKDALPELSEAAHELAIAAQAFEDVKETSWASNGLANLQIRIDQVIRLAAPYSKLPLSTYDYSPAGSDANGS